MINFRIKFFHTNHAKLENQIIIQNKINFRIKSCFMQKSINLRLKFISFDKSILKKIAMVFISHYFAGCESASMYGCGVW